MAAAGSRGERIPDVGGPAQTIHVTSIKMAELLDFEEQWPRWSGRKDEAIRARFGVSPARYFQVLAVCSIRSRRWKRGPCWCVDFGDDKMPGRPSSAVVTRADGQHSDNMSEYASILRCPRVSAGEAR